MSGGEATYGGVGAQRPGEGRAMVFHAPYPLTGGTGSAVRPVKMRDAFVELGYEVIEVTGRGADRRRATRALASRLRDGLEVDFAYGENSTMPTLLTEPHHLPTHPFVDLRLLYLLRRNGIPAGLFYRDVYWRYPEYTERVNRIVATGTRTLYHGELLAYGRWLDRVYLPSDQIAAVVPHLRADQPRALPPGGAVLDEPRVEGPFTVLYVGNLSHYYRMHELFAAVAATPDVHLLLCTPPESWAAVRSGYERWLGPRVEVVHERGEGLRPLFARADVCSLVVEPSEYRDFASPVKLYEYLGHGKPVIASAGTLAGSVVEEGGLGWQVPYAATDLGALLTRLQGEWRRAGRGEVGEVTERVRAARHGHTWAARAREVAADLGSLRRP
ncbi:glycosyltransferase [Ornithinimicrobium sp. Y1847]|uniref:glycosyltransferase n=1 Tax=unclassified Ornithinimicrobium TaxID=2615080 RepID=UPI003B66E869